MNKLLTFIRIYKHELLLSLFTVIYTVYFTAASFLRYENFYTGRFDLGNMAQTVWNTSQGRIFTFTNPDGVNIVSRLAFHADFLLIGLAPFYLIWSDPRMLLVLQTIALAFGGVVVYFLGVSITKHKTIALALSLSYFINPSVNNVNLYDFHVVSFATVFLLLAFYFLIKKNTIGFVVALFLAAMTKEQVWLVVAFFGLRFVIVEGLRRFKEKKAVSVTYLSLGVILTVVGFSLFYFLVSKAIPNARGGNHFALSYYSDFGSSPAEVLKTMLFSPQQLVGIAFAQDRIEYYKQLLMPVGYLPLLAPFALVYALPDVGISVLSNNAQLRSIYFQYTAVITSFLYIALMYASVLVMKYIPRIKSEMIVLYIVGFALFGAYFLGPLPFAKEPNITMFVHPQENKLFIQEVFAQIPQDKSVAATNNVGAHLSHREKIFTIPIGLLEADYLAFLLDDAGAQPSLQAQKEMVEELQANADYEKVFAKDDFFVFRKVQN